MKHYKTPTIPVMVKSKSGRTTKSLASKVDRVKLSGDRVRAEPVRPVIKPVADKPAEPVVPVKKKKLRGRNPKIKIRAAAKAKAKREMKIVSEMDRMAMQHFAEI